MTHNAERALNTCSLSMEGLGGEGDDELSLVAAGCVGLFAPSHCEMKAALLLLGAALVGLFMLWVLRLPPLLLIALTLTAALITTLL